MKEEEAVCTEELNKKDCTAAREKRDHRHEVRFQRALRSAALAALGQGCGGLLELLGSGWQQGVVLVFAVGWIVVCVSTRFIGSASRHRGRPAIRGEWYIQAVTPIGRLGEYSEWLYWSP